MFQNKIIYDLEMSLLDSSVRKYSDRLNNLIADDFSEIGKSGKISYKKDVIDALRSESQRKFVVHGFETRALSHELILAIYTIEENGVHSIRSSIWKKMGADYRIVFHQGTVVNNE